MNARILCLTGTPHPKVEIQSVGAQHGVAVFRWLDADSNPVDSGGSVARFAPLAPNEPENEGDAPTYPEVDDVTLTAAIENPPVESAPVVVLTPLAVISRLTDAEKLALFTSTDPQVCIWRGMATAAQEIRTDDPRTAAGFGLLVSKGILTSDRPAQILVP